jgi:hypothetical protein
VTAVHATSLTQVTEKTCVLADVLKFAVGAVMVTWGV